MDLPVRQGVEQRHVARRLVGAPAGDVVVRRPGAHQHSTDILVAEAQLDLLEGTLDQERRERVDDRPHAGERDPGADVERELLADADVNDPVRDAAPPRRRTGLRRSRPAPRPPKGRHQAIAVVVAANVSRIRMSSACVMSPASTSATTTVGWSGLGARRARRPARRGLDR